MKKTLIIGASENPERYAHKASLALLKHGHEIVLLGTKPGEIYGVKILAGRPTLENIHTVTLYINPSRQSEYYDYILNLAPRRVIFNPGTENEEFYNMLNSKGIEALEACTLVLLSTNNY